jgi:NTP pyrophosphatase (non-canonical NTP hydrolase)
MLMENWLDIWEDQAEFNLLFRQPPKDFQEKSQQTRDMVLELTEESHELLRTMDHKRHRKVPKLPNASHSEEELADMFKYFISLCQIHGVSPDRLKHLYWQKSMVCRQRHAEEFVRAIDRPCVVLDLDAVLCDYVTGILAYLAKEFQRSISPVQLEVARNRNYVNAESLGIGKEDWELVKWSVRTSDAKEHFPAMPGAKTFVDWCKSRGWLVIILTSRPIDLYPNLYRSTLTWLKTHDIHPDFIWWGSDKPERIWTVREHLQFAVDDDVRFVGQYRAASLPCYWLTPTLPETYLEMDLPLSYGPAYTNALGGPKPFIVPCRSLESVRAHYEANYPCIQTKDTAHTPTTEAKRPPLNSTEAPTD